MIIEAILVMVAVIALVYLGTMDMGGAGKIEQLHVEISPHKKRILPPAPVIKCPKCGAESKAENREGAWHCSYCGSRPDAPGIIDRYGEDIPVNWGPDTIAIIEQKQSHQDLFDRLHQAHIEGQMERVQAVIKNMIKDYNKHTNVTPGPGPTKP